MARRFADMGGASSIGVDITCYVQANMSRQVYLMVQTERKTAAQEKGGRAMQVGWLARAALELLTVGGVRSIGLEQKIGSPTPGKRLMFL